MVFYAAFNSIWVISRRQLTLLMSFLGFTITRLGLWTRPHRRCLSKTLLEKEKMLIASIFSISRNVSTHPKNISMFKLHLFCRLQMLSISKFLVWYRVNQVPWLRPHIISWLHTLLKLDEPIPKNNAFENIMEKGGYVCNQHFRLVPTMCSSLSLPYLIIQLFPKQAHFYMSAVPVFWKHWGKRRNCS